MAGVREVQSPDGRVWRVRRRWVPSSPWLPREDAVLRGTPSWWQRCGFYWVVWDRLAYPALMLAGDIAWFLASMPLMLAATLLGLRPWRVQAATIGRPRLTREVFAKGLGGSRKAIDELAAAIASGR